MQDLSPRIVFYFINLLPDLTKKMDFMIGLACWISRFYFGMWDKLTKQTIILTDWLAV